MKVYEDDDAQRNSFLENPSQINGDQIQSFRSDPSSQLPGTGSSHAAQVHIPPATDGVGIGTAPLGGSSEAMVHHADANNGIRAPTFHSSVAFREPDGQISHPGRDSSVVPPGAHSFSSLVVNQPGRDKNNVSSATLSTGAVTRNQPNQLPLSGVQTGSHKLLLGRQPGVSSLSSTWAPVTSTTTTATQSRGNTHSLGNSLSTVFTASPHGGHPRVSAAVNNDRPFTSSPSPAAAGLAQEDVLAAFSSGIEKLVSGLKSSPCHDFSHQSDSQDLNLAANRQLAWAQIKADMRAPRFTGLDPSVYKRWKVSLENEVRSLEITSVMWLELLALRTTGIAHEMVRRSDDTAADNPDEALVFVWGLFDSRFKSHPKAAEKLLMEFQQYSRVSSDDHDTLWRFAMACQQASMLMDTEQGRELTILNYPKAQIQVTGCLAPALWEKWKNYAYKYTEDQNESIPFKQFCDWILRLVKKQTHPDFERGASMFSGKGNFNSAGKFNKEPYKEPRSSASSNWPRQSPTEIASALAPNTSSGRMYSVHKIDTEISPLCAWCADKNLEASNHYLKECAEFLGSSDEDRYSFVWKKGLCFGCLESGHLCRNCNRQPKPCSNCKRRHNELISCGAPGVTAMFTGGSSFRKPTYGKTCPVVLCHNSNPDKRIEGLAIIDEGSCITLVDGNVLSRLEIPEQEFSSSPLSVITVDRSMLTKNYRTVKGLSVARLTDPEARFQIKECVEWKKLPSAIDELPSPEEVANFKELKHLTSQFPPVDPAWPTLMLIGRDCLWAMTHSQYIAPKGETPMAIQTPLGWTLVGPKPSKKTDPLPFTEKEGIRQFTHGKAPYSSSNEAEEMSDVKDLTPVRVSQPGSIGLRKYKCEFCQQDCGSYRRLAEHIKKLHPNYSQSGRMAVKTREWAPSLPMLDEQVGRKIENENIKMTETNPRVGEFDKPLKVSDDVFDLIGIRVAVRGCVRGKLWGYVKENNLQDPKDKRYFTPDEKLARVFGKIRMTASEMDKLLEPHLSEFKCYCSVCFGRYPHACGEALTFVCNVNPRNTRYQSIPLPGREIKNLPLLTGRQEAEMTRLGDDSAYCAILLSQAAEISELIGKQEEKKKKVVGIEIPHHP